MPLAHVQVQREAAEHRVATGCRSQEDLIDPELGLHPSIGTGAEGRREELRPEAHAEVRHPGEHGLPNRLLLRRDPGIRVLVPDVRPGAHDHEEVVPSPIRDRLARIDHDPVDADPAPVEHVAIDTDRVGTQVFERKCSQGTSPLIRGNHTPGDASPTAQACSRASLRVWATVWTRTAITPATAARNRSRSSTLPSHLPAARTNDGRAEWR